MKGHVSSYKLNDGTTLYLFSIRLNGKQIKHKGFLSEGDAENAMFELRREFENNNKKLYDNKQTVKYWQDYYFENNIRNEDPDISGGLAFSTQDTYEHYKEIINTYLGSYLLKDLDALQIEDFYHKYLKETKNSPNTLIKIHRYLGKTIRAAKKKKLIKDDPTLEVELPSSIPYRHKVWPSSEAKANLEKLSASYIFLVIFFAIYTGCRLGEILALNWSDVDWANRTINITKVAYRRNGITNIKPKPKTKKSNRQTVILPILYQVLQGMYKSELKSKIKNKDKLIFTDHNGQIWNPKYISKAYPGELKKYNVDKIRFHDLRHTFATILFESGVDEKIVSMALGHSSVAFTKATYVHPDNSYAAEEIAKSLKYL